MLKSSETINFVVEKLNNETTLETYYNILNIVGKRMLARPEARLTLTGCNSDNDKDNEKGRKDLSEQRADRVKEYLTSVWGIAGDRIAVESRNLPEIPSNPKVQDGQEENRRVEISSDVPEILEPVLTADTLIKISPAVIRFYPNVKSDSKVAKWKLTAMQNGESLKTFEGKGELPEKIDWTIDKDKFTVPRYDQPIGYKLEFTDESGGSTASPEGKMPLEQITIRKKQENRVGDKRIDHYSLILFQFNSAELSDENTRISKFIKSRIEPASTLLVTGYTDRMGEFRRNMDLSEDRAKAVGSFMETRNVFTRPMGPKELLYNNDLPEGRFYCRTVEVEVETPIKW